MDWLLQTIVHSFWQEPLVMWTQPDFLQYLLLTLVTGSMTVTLLLLPSQ